MSFAYFSKGALSLEYLEKLPIPSALERIDVISGILQREQEEIRKSMKSK